MKILFLLLLLPFNLYCETNMELGERQQREQLEADYKSTTPTATVTPIPFPDAYEALKQSIKNKNTKESKETNSWNKGTSYWTDVYNIKRAIRQAIKEGKTEVRVCVNQKNHGKLYDDFGIKGYMVEELMYLNEDVPCYEMVIFWADRIR